MRVPARPRGRLAPDGSSLLDVMARRTRATPQSATTPERWRAAAARREAASAAHRAPPLAPPLASSLAALRRGTLRATRGEMPDGADRTGPSTDAPPVRIPNAGSRITHIEIWAPALLFGITLLLALARQGRLIEIGYPVAAIGIGMLLVRRYPAHYVGFLCWLTFLSSEVRRLADYFNGTFNPTSPIQVAPLAVAALSSFTLLRHYRVLGTRRGLPFLMILVGIVYAYPIGILRNSPLAATWSMVQWVYPVLIGFHMMATWRSHADYDRVIVRTFTWGTLVMGLYGLVQFFILPQWDAFWLIGTRLVTEGLPEPFEIRVSSTMNSSAPFAITMVTALLLLAARPGRMGWLSGAAGTMSLLLSVVRAAWGGWFVGMVYLTFNLSNRMRLRVVVSLLALAVLAIPAAMSDPVYKIIQARFETIGKLSNDTSFNERSSFYSSYLSTAFSEITGTGLGVSGDATRLNKGSGGAGQQFGSFDSGLMEVPYTLGWSGALLFFGGVGWLLIRALAAARRAREDRVASAFISASLALFAMLVFLNTLTGASGMLFYIGVVMPLIASKVARQ